MAFAGSADEGETTLSDRELNANLIHRINVGDSLTRAAARSPGSCAVVDADRRYTYGEFNAWVNQVANGLSERGYRRGDVLALASGNSVEFLVTYFACAKVGVVCVPINLGWASKEVTYVLDHSAARGLVVESQLLPTMSDAVHDVDAVVDLFVAPGTGAGACDEISGRNYSSFADLADSGSDSEPEHIVEDRDPISYLYTSGTTSAPKGVVGNHAAVYLESMTMALEARFASDDRFVAMLPMFHTAQLNCHCTAAVMVGATIFIRRR